MNDYKLNTFVRIRGNAQRGKDVIKELEKRGGRNLCNLKGDVPRQWYFISSTGYISYYQPWLYDDTDFFLDNYEEIELPRWRAEVGEEYWYVSVDGNCFRPHSTTERYTSCDNCYWAAYNYFSSESEAQEKANAINDILQGDTK